MAKRHEIEEALNASVRWPPELRKGGALDATVGWLRMQIGEQALTRYRTDNGQEGDEVQIPVYDLAEWIALNWWALLCEPKKTDHAEQDFDFRSRHWLGVARNGFALPDAWVIPVGGKIEIAATECYLPAARVRFTSAMHVAVNIDRVVEALGAFVDVVVERLKSVGIEDTVLQGAWRDVRETPADAMEFCGLVGALGLSPYESHPEVEALLDKLSAELPRSVVRDLCEALEPSVLLRVAPIAERVWEALAGAPEFDISRLAVCPTDATADRAALWGLEAAWQARKAIGVNRSDPAGGDAFLGALGLTAAIDRIPSVQSPDQQDELAGAVARCDSTMRLALTQDHELARRRFAGARGAFLAWSGKNNSSRLLTNGRTRDQQASRAFAAEILAPISYIRSKAYNRTTLAAFRVTELAQELGVSTAVIANQARSHGIFVTQG
jgi:hypothetical protein